MCPHFLSGAGLPEEGTNDDTSVPVVQGEGKVLLCLWDLRSSFLCLKEGVEEAKPGSTTSIGTARLPSSVPCKAHFSGLTLRTQVSDLSWSSRTRAAPLEPTDAGYCGEKAHRY